MEWHTDAQTGIMVLTLCVSLIGNYFATVRSLRGLINKHEKADERRHTQNLARFNWIASSMARLGNQTNMPTFDDG